MTDRADIVREARGWLGTPWKHQGRLRGVGVDCVGFVAEVGRAVGILDIQEAANYRRRPDASVLRARMDANMTPIQKSELLPADVVLLATHSQPNHVGMIGDYPLGDGLSLIHAYLPARKVIEHRLDPTWMARIVAAYRIRGIA